MKLAERLHATHRFWRYRLTNDRHEIAFIRKHVARSQTVLDIGAHRGAYTYWLARAVGPSGTVYAFEPLPELVRYMEEIRQAFGLSNVRIIAKALSSANGEFNLFKPNCHPLGAATLESLSDFDGTYITVSTVRLDDFVEREPDLPRPISFISAMCKIMNCKFFKVVNAYYDKIAPHSCLSACRTAGKSCLAISRALDT